MAHLLGQGAVRPGMLEESRGEAKERRTSRKNGIAGCSRFRIARSEP